MTWENEQDKTSAGGAFGGTELAWDDMARHGTT
jgi:hypothetical protein